MERGEVGYQRIYVISGQVSAVRLNHHVGLTRGPAWALLGDNGVGVNDRLAEVGPCLGADLREVGADPAHGSWETVDGVTGGTGQRRGLQEDLLAPL